MRLPDPAPNSSKNRAERFMHPAAKPASGLTRFMRSEDGISFIECALLASLVAAVISIALLAASKSL